MNKMLDKFSLLHKIAIIIGGVVSVLLFATLRYHDINNLYLLPLCYTVSMFLVKGYYNDNNMGLAVGIIEITKFIRFILVPLIYAMTDGFVRNDIRPIYHSTAVLLMCYELAAVSLVMFFFIRRHKFDKKAIGIEIKQPFIVYVVVIAWLFLVLFVGAYRECLFNFNITANTSSSNSGGGKFVFSYLFVIGLIYTYSLLIGLSDTVKNRMGKFLVILFASVFYISSSWNNGGESISRWGLIIGFILFLYVLFVFYPHKKNFILYVGLSSIIFLIGVSSVLKLIVWGYNVSNFSDSSEFLFTSDMFDIYFQGVYSVSNGLATADSFADRVGIMSFLNELLNHFPGAYQIFGFKDYAIAETFFKFGVHDNSLICPSLIQSYYYFGALGSPLFSCFSVYLALLFSVKIQKERKIAIRLLYISSIFWLSLYNCVNYTVVEAHIWFYLFGILLCKIESYNGKNIRPISTKIM